VSENNNAIASTIQMVIGTLKVAPPYNEVQQAISVLEALKEKTIRVGAAYQLEIDHLNAQLKAQNAPVVPKPFSKPAGTGWKPLVFTPVPYKKTSTLGK
jgi:hypothetical protein